MNREIIEQAAASYADSIPQSDERKRYCREDFIAGAEWLAAYLCEIPFDKIIIELGDWWRGKRPQNQLMTYPRLTHDLPPANSRLSRA